ncbi:zinc finger domain-containing, phd-finger [Trichoderma arundinaceum]|uniref:Zinc finger domain-containing, phd-finger n=1 Tax=Trichoderma arundinaceum TaxID=490622 RepID=A0A395P0B2_TRIAR|nr:zinc finger domain-containing, phd-finger [Trichoderma arundinaceum]
MISSNTRASRSRFSSPSRPLEAKSSAGNDGSKTFMQRWLEPSVQSKASFEEAGLMRYGVLETMAPLGALPKSKKTGSEAGAGHQSVRKIILRPSGTTQAASHQDEQAALPRTRPRASSPPAPSTPPPPASAPLHRRSQAAKDTEDEEYDPKGASRRRQSRRVSLPAKQPRQHTSTGESKSTAVVTITTPKAKAAATPKRVRRREAEDIDFADKVVEAAVDEALMHYRYPTAWALRSLYDERCGDSDFVAMVEDVFKQRADADTMDEFVRLIEAKKREGKKDDQGCYYFVPPSTNSRFTPHKPMAAPYARLLLHHAAAADDDDKVEMRAAKRSKTSHTSETPRSKKLANGTKSHGDSIKTPSRRRNRRDSGSSESSLSSAMSLSSPEASVHSLSPSLQHGAGKMGKSTKAAHARTASGGGDGGSGGGGATVADTVIAATSTTGDRSQSSHDAPKSRPITSTRRKSLASDKQPVSNSSEPNSPTLPSRTHTSATDASMPGRVTGSELLLSKSTSNGRSVCNKDGSSAVKAQMPADEDDLFWTRRRDAQKVTNAYTARESSVRTGDDDERDDVTPARRTRRTRNSLAAPISTRSTRSASKRPSSNNNNDDVDITVSSPLAFSFNEGSSTVGSRAATPTGLRPTKKPRTGLRIKLSPMKKKGGTAAGVPRSTGEAQSVTVSNGAPRDQSDHLPDEWYCNECLVRRYPSRVPIYKGAFASALNALEKSIPRAFSLPKKIQNRFEGVKAGADGDYEEVTSNKAKKRAGYDELPDFFKQREDGEAVLCHACQKPATEIRAIIPCSACPFHWHIDCLDPPLAMPPVLKTWRCPAHVDDVLGEVPPLAPAHRFRKVKGGQIITPAFSRGIRNNGHIELDWADEPEESEKSGWRDPDSFGKTYRLQAKGVVLDFIEQLRHRGAGYGSRRDELRWVSHAAPSTSDAGGLLVGSAYDRKVNEMQASLNLLGLKQSRSENIDQLTAALLSAADDNVLALMARGNADNIASGHLIQEDRMSLRAMLAQMDAMGDRIRHLLGDEAPPTALIHKAIDRDSPPITDASGVDTFPEKTEPTAPVTEPTPPSTVDHGEGNMELD